MHLADYISNDARYLFTMVDHFIKYGWEILMKINRQNYLECFQTMIDIIFKTKSLHTDNGGVFNDIVMENYFLKNNIDHITWDPYNLKH